MLHRVVHDGKIFPLRLRLADRLIRVQSVGKRASESVPKLSPDFPLSKVNILFFYVTY